MDLSVGSKSLLANDLKIKPSQLYVRDLQKVAAFYRDAVGLDSLLATSSRVMLGHDNVPVLELISKPEYRNSSIKNAGLFHNAILYSSQSALAQAVLRVLQTAAWSYEGSADHLVSEAFYFHDPEGNGLELYFDRPRDSWQWTEDGVRMDTLPLDPERYIIGNLNGDIAGDKALGHVHLRVGDVSTARSFYVNKLGFDVTAEVSGALFVSVGGYHHHMAMNTWFSQGASRRDPALGLADIKLVLPNDSSIDKLADRLAESELKYSYRRDQLLVSDPWNNQLVFTVE